MSLHTSPVITPAQMLLTTRRSAGGTVVVAVVGEVDMATAHELHAALLDALRVHTPTVLDVDLSGCTFLDCSGIGVLVAAHATAQAAGCQMWARYPRLLVRLMLEVTDLLDLLTAPNDATVQAAGSEDGAGRRVGMESVPSELVAV